MEIWERGEQGLFGFASRRSSTVTGAVIAGARELLLHRPYPRARRSRNAESKPESIQGMAGPRDAIDPRHRQHIAGQPSAVARKGASGAM